MALGEFFAFIVGWSLILENLIGIAAISRSCSGYFDSLIDKAIQNYTINFINDNITTHQAFHHIDFFAFLIVFIFVGFLTFGVRVTSYLNNILSIMNIFVIIVVVIVGSFYADINNWKLEGKGFAPNGLHGIFAASASCFYAYIGFDSIATSAEEAKDPQKSIPMATMISMAFATIAYVSVSAVLTLMVPYDQLNNESGLPDALGRFSGAIWCKYLVILGASCGMISVLIGTMYSLTRCVYAMSEDGLLYRWMGEIHKGTQIPLKSMYFFASIGAVLALTFELTMLVEMMSIGTLLAYLVVSASVIVARYTPSDSSVNHQILQEDEVGVDGQELNEIGSTADQQIDPNNQFKHQPIQQTNSSSSILNDNQTEFRSTNQNPIMCWLLKHEFLHSKWRSIQELKQELITFKLKKYPSTSLPSTNCVFIMIALIFILCSLGPNLVELSSKNGYYAIIIFILALLLAITFGVLTCCEQHTDGLRYKVPWVPFIPTLSILFNAVMITNLNKLTWIRFIVWIFIGFFIYFGYGIKNSVLNPESRRVKNDLDTYRSWGSISSDDNPKTVILHNSERQNQMSSTKSVF